MSRSLTGGLAAELSTERLTESERHRLLAAEERRLALDALAARTDATDLSELAADVATRKEGGAVGSETVEQLEISLHHAHLPIMDELGVVDYDPESRIATPRTDTC